MVSLTTKRKDPPNRTLLDFFSGPDAIKRARVGTLQQSTPGLRQTKVPSREIIVIDSDSDDGARGKEIGRRGARVHINTVISEGSPSLSSTAFTPVHSGDKDAFGVPSELLQSINLHVETSSKEFHVHEQSTPTSPEPEHQWSMFGVSAPLLEQTSLDSQSAEKSRTNIVAPENMTSVGGANSVDGRTADFSIEEWVVGDDELAGMEVQDNRTDTDGGEPSDEQRFCPMCGTDLTGIVVPEAQTHVNQCLDMTLQNDNLVLQKCTSIEMPIEPSSTSDNSGSNTFIKGQGDNLYTVLMSAHKENEIWAEADAAVKRDIRPTRGNPRRAPFFKVLQGMPIAVDAFCYGTIPGVTAYFLTHAHSDHYTSLGSKWKSGPIYCSEETAKLIIHMLAVDPRWIHPLPLDISTSIPNTGGVSVTLIEANHCPGSCLFLFEGRQTIDAGDSTFKSPFVGSPRNFRYLHCGDFRASPRHVFHPAVKGKYIDHIYLDTTYLDPKYTFSPQPLVISACVELTRRLVGNNPNPNAHTSRKFTMDAWIKPSNFPEREGQQTQRERTLVIVGTYSIGKERIVKAIAQALETKIYCDPRKTAILRCQTDEELHALLTTDPAEANVHILPLGIVTADNLKSYLQRFKGTFARVIGFRPTGWTYTPPSGIDLDPSIQSIISYGQLRKISHTDLQPSQKSSHNVQIFGVPYSEHSSFFELTCFAMSSDWGRIIPTVNMGSPTSRAKLMKWLKRWESEKRSTKLSVIQPRTIDYW